VPQPSVMSVAMALVPPDPPKPSSRPAGGSHCLGYHLALEADWWVAGATGKGQLRVIGSPSALLHTSAGQGWHQGWHNETHSIHT
jgi:hypothetical protein